MDLESSGEVPLTAVTARSQGLMSCHVCHKLSKAPKRPREHSEMLCPRCGAPMHMRYPNSLSATWALVVASFLLYIPANTLPVLTVVMLGQGNSDTIMSGVVHLLEGGMWPLALIVFVASILVPVLKLSILAGLLISVRYKNLWRRADRSRLYRITEFIGRWSMVDVFVIAILVALVQFGNLADVDPGAGALSFGAVVVLTMFAAHTFDPRLIWDDTD